MRIPAVFRERGQLPREQVSIMETVSSPVGGLNTRDQLAEMDPRDAIILENWFCRTTDVTIRGGCANHVTGFGSRPKSLMLYSPPTGVNKMFASTDSAVYDTSNAGAVGASVASCTNGYWNWFQMGVSGGHYLLNFNGTDKPLYYDGTNWISVDGASAPALTGVTTTNLITGNVFKRRLFVIEKNKLSFWYLAVDAVGGALTEFTLGPLCSKGGFLMAMGTWTFDSGLGIDDYAVFVTSEGEVIVFRGSNPGDSTNWALVGVFQLASKPIGRKCFIKYGGDLILLTEFGALPLTRTLKTAAISYREAITNKIEKSFTEAAASFGSLAGWEATVYPAQNALVVNVPNSSTLYTQYVMNTITRNWCKFTGWNASAFVVYNKELYFADATKVAKAWVGRSDYGANIVALAQTSFSNFKRNQSKHPLMFRPLLAVDGNLSFGVAFALDFQTAGALSPASYSTVTGAKWDVDLWDVGIWASGLEIRKGWQSPRSDIGVWISGVLRIDTNALEVQWPATDYLFEMGGVIG